MRILNSFSEYTNLTVFFLSIYNSKHNANLGEDWTL